MDPDPNKNIPDLTHSQQTDTSEAILPAQEGGIKNRLSGGSRFFGRNLYAFIMVFAILAGLLVFRAFAASNPTTECLPNSPQQCTNGTTPNGYTTACIDPNAPGDGNPGQFIHVQSCTQAEKSEGWTNSSSFVWCADLGGSKTPVENNWLNDGGCPGGGGGGGGGGSGGQNCSTPGSGIYADETLQVCFWVPGPNTITTDNPMALLQWQVNGNFSYCEKVMAPNSPNNDPFWTGHVPGVGSTNETYSQLGQYIPVIRCFDSSGKKIGHQYETITLVQGSGGGGGSCSNPPTVYGDQGTHHVPAPVTTSSSATVYGFVNENAPPNATSCKTTYYFDWGPTKTPNNQSPDTPPQIPPPENNQQQTVQTTITGLNSNTTYYYYPCATYTVINQGAPQQQSICSSIQSFTTQDSGGGGGCGYNNFYQINLAAACGGSNGCDKTYTDQDRIEAQKLLCNHYKGTIYGFTYNGDGAYLCDHLDDCKDLYNTMKGNPLGSGCNASSINFTVTRMLNTLIDKGFFGNPAPGSGSPSALGTSGLCSNLDPTYTTQAHQNGLAVDIDRIKGLGMNCQNNCDYTGTLYQAKRVANYLGGNLSISPGGTIPGDLIPKHLITDGVDGKHDGDSPTLDSLSLPGNNNYSSNTFGLFQGRMYVDYGKATPFQTIGDAIASNAINYSCPDTCPISQDWPHGKPKPNYIPAMTRYGTYAGGYSYTDCGRFVATMMRMTIDKNYPASGVAEQWSYVNNSKHYKVFSIGSQSQLQAGDILFAGKGDGGNGHTELYVGSAPNGNARDASLFISYDGNPPQPGSYYSGLTDAARYVP